MCMWVHQDNNMRIVLQCTLYINEIQVMIQSLQELKYNPSINNLLCGDKIMSEDKTKRAKKKFEIMWKFIAATGRFD